MTLPTFGEAAQIVTAAAALGAWVISLRNGKRIHEIHLSINSRMDELLKITGEERHAAGVQEERSRER